MGGNDGVRGVIVGGGDAGERATSIRDPVIWRRGH